MNEAVLRAIILLAVSKESQSEFLQNGLIECVFIIEYEII